MTPKAPEQAIAVFSSELEAAYESGPSRRTEGAPKGQPSVLFGAVVDVRALHSFAGCSRWHCSNAARLRMIQARRIRSSHRRMCVVAPGRRFERHGQARPLELHGNRSMLPSDYTFGQDLSSRPVPQYRISITWSLWLPRIDVTDEAWALVDDKRSGALSPTCLM